MSIYDIVANAAIVAMIIVLIAVLIIGHFKEWFYRSICELSA